MMNKKTAKLPVLILGICLLAGFALAQFVPLPFMKKSGLAIENFGLKSSQGKAKEKIFEVMNDIELSVPGKDGKSEMVPLAKGTIVKISEDGSISVATKRAEPPKP